MKNKSFVARKVKKLEDALTRLENGQYCDLSTEYIISQIDWLWRFRYITHGRMEKLADRVLEILGGKEE